MFTALDFYILEYQLVVTLYLCVKCDFVYGLFVNSYGISAERTTHSKS